MCVPSLLEVRRALEPHREGEVVTGRSFHSGAGEYTPQSGAAPAAGV